MKPLHRGTSSPDFSFKRNKMSAASAHDGQGHSIRLSRRTFERRVDIASGGRQPIGPWDRIRLPSELASGKFDPERSGIVPQE